MTQYALLHFYRGKLYQDDLPTGDYVPVAYAQELSSAECDVLTDRIYAGSHSSGGINRDFEGWCLNSIRAANGEIYAVFARVWRSPLKDRGHHYPQYHVVLVPPDALAGWGYHVLDLAAQLHAAPGFPRLDAPQQVAPLTVHLTAPTPDQAVAYQDAPGDLAQRIGLLGAVLEGRFVRPVDVEPPDRLRLMQALLLLLPRAARTLLSFATETFSDTGKRFNIAFSHSPAPGDRLADFSDQPTSNRYIAWLRHLMGQGAAAVMAQVGRASEDLAVIQRQHSKLEHALHVLGNHYLLAHEGDQANPGHVRLMLRDDPLVPDAEKSARLMHLLEAHLSAAEDDRLAAIFSDDALNRLVAWQHLAALFDPKKPLSDAIEPQYDVPPYRFPLLLAALDRLLAGQHLETARRVVQHLPLDFWLEAPRDDASRERAMLLLWRLGEISLALDWLDALNKRAGPFVAALLEVISPGQVSTLADRLAQRDGSGSRPLTGMLLLALLDRFGPSHSSTLYRFIVSLWQQGALTLTQAQVLTLMYASAQAEDPQGVLLHAVQTAASTDLPATLTAFLIGQGAGQGDLTTVLRLLGLAVPALAQLAQALDDDASDAVRGALGRMSQMEAERVSSALVALNGLLADVRDRSGTGVLAMRRGSHPLVVGLQQLVASLQDGAGG